MLSEHRVFQTINQETDSCHISWMRHMTLTPWYSYDTRFHSVINRMASENADECHELCGSFVTMHLIQV